MSRGGFERGGRDYGSRRECSCFYLRDSIQHHVIQLNVPNPKEKNFLYPPNLLTPHSSGTCPMIWQKMNWVLSSFLSLYVRCIHCLLILSFVAQIKTVKIIKDRDDRPKGFGYVEFADLDGLKDALSKSGSVRVAVIARCPTYLSTALPKSTHQNQRGISAAYVIIIISVRNLTPKF